MERESPASEFSWRVVAMFMLIAGTVHVALIESHLSHAIGAGAFFAIVGVGQIVWAAWLFMGRREYAAAGAMAFAVAPSLLYVLTRFARSPWSAGPEPFDAMGVATLGAQLLALLFFAKSFNTQRFNQVATTLVVGSIVGLGGYASALAIEDTPWLSQSVSLHGEHGHEEHDAAHGDHGHAAQPLPGFRGVTVVGNVSYYGPETAAELIDTCESEGDPIDCWSYYLKGILQARGSIPAFDVLDEMMEANKEVGAQSHTIAHVLGNHAYMAYGLNITLTLSECSYKVFQGCLHGAMQAFFADLAAQGEQVDQQAMRSLCAGATTNFESYSCNHGVGHGIMIHSNYALHDSLDDCEMLPDWLAIRSCMGGVFMENVVAYTASLQPDYVPHHGNVTPAFWIDEDDPAFPCNVVKTRYADACWVMQTSVVLRFNGGNFQKASAVCDDAGKQRLACYKGLGRDAGGYANQNPSRMSKYCSYGDDDAEVQCVRAFTAGRILTESDPLAALPLCSGIATNQKSACYAEMGDEASAMYNREEAEAVCAQAPSPYDQDCLGGMRD